MNRSFERMLLESCSLSEFIGEGDQVDRYQENRQLIKFSLLK